MSKYRVMVVDDDPDIRFVTSGLLGDDFEMVQAESGLDALEKIERYEPDLLLLDVYMPIMDGFATCRSVRRHAQFGEMPVFFLTGASSDDARRRASEAQSQGFVEKPFDTNALVDSIRSFFGDSRVPPRLKTFTMRELKKIDATPLRTAADEDSAQAPAAPVEATASQGEQPAAEQPPEKTRTRRVFGAAAKPAPPPAVPLPAEDEEEPGTKRMEITPEMLQAARRAPDEQPIPKAGPTTPPPAESPEPGVDPNYPQLPKRKAFTLESDSGFFAGAGAPPPGKTPPPVAPHKPLVPAPEPTPRIKATPPAAPPAAAPPPKPSAPSGPVPAPSTTPTVPMPPLVRPRREIPAAAKAGGAPASLRPRVLCVIAEPAEMNAYALALKGIAEFLPLQDPVEAVEIIARFQPDIVFVRVVAKEFSGIQLATLLKANPRIAHTEVVFLDTGRESPQQQAAAARASSNPTVRIPVDENTVRNAVKRIVAKPGFAVREKKLAYGAYVSEVLQAERGKAEAVRQAKEKEFEKQRASALGEFMTELHKVAGNKPIPESMLPKTAQAYYLS